MVIRQAILDKSIANISGPYKNNPDVNYDVVEAEQYLNNHLASSVPVDLTDMQKVVKYIEQSIVVPVNIALAKVGDDFNAKLTGINNQIGRITNDDISEFIAKSSKSIYHNCLNILVPELTGTYIKNQSSIK